MEDDYRQVKSWRKGLDLTQKQVAEEIGVTITHYNQIETGKRKPGIKTAGKLAEFYGVPLTKIIVLFYKD